MKYLSFLIILFVSIVSCDQSQDDTIDVNPVQVVTPVATSPWSSSMDRGFESTYRGKSGRGSVKMSISDPTGFDGNTHGSRVVSHVLSTFDDVSIFFQRQGGPQHAIRQSIEMGVNVISLSSSDDLNYKNTGSFGADIMTAVELLEESNNILHISSMGI